LDVRTKKASLSIFLALALLLTLLPAAAFADGNDIPQASASEESSAADTASVTVDITDHQQSRLMDEIEDWLTKAGDLEKSSVSGLSVSGGTMDVNDFEYLADNFMHLSSIDLSGTSLVDDKVPDKCFEEFEDLSSIKLPNSVTAIGVGAFAGCTSIGEFTCPYALEIIEDFAFIECTSLKSVTFFYELSSIGVYAFDGCASLESVWLPENITEISMSTFSRCTSLVSVGLPSGLEKIGSLAFYGCTSLEEVTIPRFVEVIEGGAFYECSNLKNVEMLSSAPPSTVAENAFLNVAPDAVVHVLAGCGINYRSGNTEDNYWRGLYINEMELVLSNGIGIRETDSYAHVSFSANMFFTPYRYYYAVVDYGDDPPAIDTTGAGHRAAGLLSDTIQLNSLTVGAKDIYIVAKSGDKLSNVLKVEIPAYTSPPSVVIRNHKAGALAQEIEAFLNINGYSGANEIRELKIKGGVLDAADQDYLSSDHLRYIEKIDLSETSFDYNGANIMKDGLFSGKPYVTVILPEGLTAVSNGAFSSCMQLKNVNIPSSIASIGEEAFRSCVNLETIMIPAGVTEIGDNAFYRCSTLLNVIMDPAIPPRVGSNAFADAPWDALVSVPAGSGSAYKAADDSDTTDDLWHGMTIFERNASVNDIIMVRWISITVPWKTDKHVVSLPDRVDAILDDGRILKIETDWDYDNTPYDGTIQGDYEFSGVLKNLPAGVRNGLNITVSAEVKVLPPLSAEIIPGYFNFDPNNPKDIVAEIIWNDDRSISRVLYGESIELSGYEVNGNILTIRKEDIQGISSPNNNIMFGVFFDNGGSDIFEVNIMPDYQTGTDASLERLLYGEHSVIGFRPDRYEYGVTVPGDTTLAILARAIYGKPNDPLAKVRITMPAALPGSAEVEVTAEDGVTKRIYTINFTIRSFSVKFDKNGGDTDADPVIMSAAAGECLVSLPQYPVRPGYTFMGWNTRADGRGTPFTEYTPVTSDMTVYAQWRAISSGGSSGNSGSSGSNPVPGPISDTVSNEAVLDDGIVTVVSTIPAVMDQNGKASAAITQTQIDNAISLAAEKAKQEQSGAARIQINVDAPADAASVEISINKASMGQVAESGSDAFAISTPVASVTFDEASLKTITDEAEADIRITAARVDTESLAPEAKQAVGDRPVFDFRVVSGDKPISQFGGNVAVSVPYTPKAGEDPNAIVIYYINADGGLEIVTDCVYDPATGKISFTTNHFSIYAVGYNKVSFKDVPASAWYSDAVSFIAARGITNGTGDGYFSPEAKLTRAQFIVMLMKAYGISPDADAKDNFADAGAAYYTGYLAAAKQLGISAGIGNNLFGPGREITRQEMLTLTYNALRTIGRLPEGSSGKALAFFSDAGSVASWAKEAMTFLTEAGIISGNDGRLSPTAAVTRAEMAQVLYNLLTPAGRGETGKTVRSKDIAVLFTGDVHCAVDDNIGYAGLAAFKKELESQGVQVLLVDTGDAIQGAPIGSLSGGKMPISIMNRLGYCAMTLGNHEFDYGQEALGRLSEMAEFPFLSLNFVDMAGGEPIYRPYTIMERYGVKIAFVGVSTPTTLTSSTPKFFMDDNGRYKYSFLQDESGKKLWDATQKAVDAARKEGADYVIAMTHLGIDASTAPYLSTELIANTSGIDVVLDGHSHSVIECDRVLNKDGKRVLMSSTGTGLNNIGCLLIDRNGGLSTRLVSDYEKKDEGTTAYINSLKAEFGKQLEQPVASVRNDLVTEDPVTGVRIVRRAETNLGDLCADAIRAATNADIAVMNGGGIRAGIKAGETTYGDVLSVFPFGNHLCTIQVTGQQLLDALELSVSAVPDEYGGFLQVSGLTFTYRTDIQSPVKRDDSGMFAGIEGERRVETVMVNGEPLSADKTYTLAGTEYTLRDSGDGYSMFAGCPVLEADVGLDFDVLVDFLTDGYLKDTSVYQEPYGDGRIEAVQ
jgi:uncharacterized repeat protein (TIGR02543 family)